MGMLADSSGSYNGAMLLQAGFLLAAGLAVLAFPVSSHDVEVEPIPFQGLELPSIEEEGVRLGDGEGADTGAVLKRAGMPQQQQQREVEVEVEVQPILHSPPS